MPKNTNQRLSKRRGVTAKETYRYTPKSSVEAHTVDSMERPGKNSTLNNLVTALDKGQDLLSQYAEVKQQHDKGQFEEGYTMGRTGQELPDDADTDKLEGYLVAEGEGSVYQFEQHMTKYLQENPDLSPEEFQQGANEIMKSFVQDQPEAFLKGFVPNARKVEHRVYQKFQQFNQQQIANEGLSNIVSSFKQEMDTILDNMGEGDELPTKRLRKLATEKWKLAKKMGLGLTRNEVSSRLLETVGRKAEITGNPDLIRGFAKEVDKDGISLTDTKLAPEVRTWEERALKTYDEIHSIRNEKAEQYQKQMKNRMDKEIAMQLKDIQNWDKNAGAAEQTRRMVKEYLGLEQPAEDIVLSSENVENTLLVMRQSIRDKYSEFLPKESIEDALGTIDSMLDTSGFAETDSAEARKEAISAYMDMETPNDFKAARDKLMDLKSDLTSDTWTKHWRDFLQEREKIEDEQYGAIKQYKNDELQTLEDRVTLADNSLFSITKPTIDRADVLRKRDARRQLNQWFYTQQWKTGEVPTPKEIEDKANTIADRVLANDAYAKPEYLSMSFGSLQQGVNNKDDKQQKNNREAAMGGNSGNNNQKRNIETEKQEISSELDNMTDE